ncbi:MAG: hypothetical protein AABY83_03080 [Pseudomonadota bacterium]
MGNPIRTHSALLLVLGLYAPHVLSASSASEGGQDSVVLSWYIPGAMSGDAEAQYNLGYLYESGWGVDANRGQAIHWYRQAADNQHALSQVRLGMMLYAGIGANPDQDEGMRWLRTAANNGSQVALRLIDKVITDLGSSGEDINIIRKAYRLLEEGEARVVELLDAEAPMRVAGADVVATPKPSAVLTQKQDIPKPPSIADSLMVDASALNVEAAPFKRAPTTPSSSTTNTTVPAAAPNLTVPDDRNAWNKRQLDEGDFNFRPRIDPTPTPTETVTASASVKPALTAPLPDITAKTGDADIEFNLGVTFLKGQGVTRDEAQGIRWIRAAAARNHDVARKFVNLLDQAEASSATTPALQSLVKAARWWDIDAFYEIGHLYDTGQSIAKDNAVAQQWYRLASTLGNRDATMALKNIAEAAGSSTFAPFTSRTKTETASASMFDGAMVEATQSKRMPVFKAMAVIAILSALVVWLLRTLSRLMHARRTQTPSYERTAPAGFATRSSGPLVVEVNDMEFMRDLWGRPPGQVLDGAADTSAKEPRASRQERRTEAPNMGQSTPGVAPSAPAKPLEAPEVAAVKERSAPAPHQQPETQQPMAGAESVVVNTTTRPKPKDQDIPTVTARVAGPVDHHHHPKPYRKTVSSSTQEGMDMDGLAFDKLDVKAKSTPADTNASMHYTYRAPAQVVVDATQPAATPKEYNKAPNATSGTINTDDTNTLGRVQFNIAMMFARGDGVVRNDVLAAKWFEKAAKLGNAEAQFRMWALCSTGRSGIALDTKQAHFWLHRAAASGHAPAVEVMQRQQRLATENRSGAVAN